MDCSCDANNSDAAIDGAPGRMVSIPPGTFSMGCNPAVDTDCSADESPYHTVTLSAYEIDRYEVTQAEYKACIDASMCTVPAANYDPATTPDLPVRDVNWNQAVAYCTFAGKRLPTEAEWERAARSDDGRKYPWGNDAPDCTRANYMPCGGAPLPAGRPAGESPFLELDAAGNVWEWVADYYDPSYYAVSPDTNPPGPQTGTYRVARGGSFQTTADSLRTSRRISGNPVVAYDDFGIRCAR